LVGAPEKALPVSAFALLFGNKTLSGSIIGGIAETKTCSTSAASTTSPPMSR
jgi:D-arabinose 1-dehydrogenase-like Zn-dependent alcohol dehydrogenase